MDMPEFFVKLLKVSWIVPSKKQMEFAGTMNRLVEADSGLTIEYHTR